MIAADELESGGGQIQATITVNEWRKQQDPPRPEVCRATVVAAAKQLGAQKRRRMKVKVGNTDAGSVWAQCRLEQAIQFLAQLRAGRRQGVCSLRPIYIAGISFWDEKHKKVHNGCASKWQWRVPRDPATVLYLSCQRMRADSWRPKWTSPPVSLRMRRVAALALR
jgi:hypothetical protein